MKRHADEMMVETKRDRLFRQPLLIFSIALRIKATL